MNESTQSYIEEELTIVVAESASEAVKARLGNRSEVQGFIETIDERNGKFVGEAIVDGLTYSAEADLVNECWVIVR